MVQVQYPSPERQRIAAATSRMLLEVKAVDLRLDRPWMFASGLASPIAIDCRKLIAYPRIRRQLTCFCVDVLSREVGHEQFDVVAGGETAGIPYAAWVADRLLVPMVYVRKQPKGFGRNARIEGVLQDGQRALLVEDLALDGASKIAFAEALRQAGASVAHTAAVFHFDVLPGTAERLRQAQLTLHPLAGWEDLAAVARADGLWDRSALAQIEAFLAAPLAWSAAHGGIYDSA